MKILVTGKNGQLAQSFRRLAVLTPWLWLFYSRNELDITVSDAVESIILKERPDVIINTAAYTRVDQAESDSDKAFLVNKSGVQNLVNAAKQIGADIIHYSTDYVFSGKGHRPFKEDDATTPSTVYGRSKLDGERVLLEQYPAHSFVVRTSWLFSEYGHNFVKTMIRLSQEKESISVVDDQFGNPTYAGDLAEATFQILKSIENKTPTYGIYHIANKLTTNWHLFAEEIIKQNGSLCQVNPISSEAFPTPALRPEFSGLNTEKFETIFTFALRDWKSALNECMTHLKEWS